MALWTLLFAAVAAAAPTPAARTADGILAALREPGARAVVVNVWATWCLPCREEMPALLRLRRAWANRGLRLVLVSADFFADVPQAAAFLGELGVDFPTYRKDGSDMELIEALDPTWSGALPATFVYDANGRLRQSFHGPVSYEQLERSVRGLIEPEKESHTETRRHGG